MTTTERPARQSSDRPAIPKIRTDAEPQKVGQEHTNGLTPPPPSLIRMGVPKPSADSATDVVVKLRDEQIDAALNGDAAPQKRQLPKPQVIPNDPEVNFVRRIILIWGQMPVDQQLEYAKNGRPSHKVALALSPNLAEEAKKILEADEDPHVVSALKRRANFPIVIAKGDNGKEYRVIDE